MTVEREGRWYVSPTYTGAEALRRSLDPEPAMPTFAEPLDAIGGDSPEGVVQDLAAAIDDLDLTAMFGLTSPSRARVLHDYAPMLIEAAGELDPDEVALADVELTTAGGPDGTTLVTVTGYELRFTQDDGSTSYRLADGCLTTSWDYADAYADEFSGDESWFPEEVSSCEPFDPSNRGYPGFFARGGLFGFGLEAPVFTVVEEDGRWYLDPLDSLGTSIVSMLRDLSTDELQWTVRWWSGAVWLIQPDELWAACGIDRPADGVDRETGEAALDRCIEQLPAEYTGGWYPSPYGGADIADPAIDDEWTDPTEGCRGAAPAAVDSCLRRLVDDGLIAPVDACWAQPDQAATYSCFERGVADGTIDALDGCYVLDDLDATGSCLRDGVAAGTVDEAEAGRFECERSVDWRAPDDEAMAAYDACVAGVDGSP